MPDGTEQITVKVIPSISDVSQEAWDECAGTSHPFTRHAFFSALEDSGSATAETGWQPQHMIIEQATGGLLAAVPLYLKNHSYGEYVFDWGWADAFERAGGNYYPKLQCSVPFTPVTGARFLIPDHIENKQAQDLRKALGGAMIQLAHRLEVSSIHVTFSTKDEWKLLTDVGFLQRLGQQFHWHNKGYRTFDDFLEDLNSRKRKQIRKERRAVAEKDLSIQALSGAEIKEHHWDAFYQFYLSTVDKKWGSSYLTRSFFSLLGERMADQVVLFMVEDAGNLVGGALNLKSDTTLFGRNWGCLATHKFLHFEACYYQAIDYAIQHGLQRVEAGAQGPHKIQRGYLPSPTYSSHWISHPGLKDAIEDFLARERLGMEFEMHQLAQHSPFRNTEQS
ncbi:MAG: N-acetyltransferase [Rhodospirillales bacterium]|nr:N-acetyltransferase [Rhodospirillales bacterium]